MNDEIIGYQERSDPNPDSICRITALWLTNEKDEILIAQRSFSKKHGPGQWGPAVAGTVEKGETYDSNILKEAEEEIGLTNTKLLLAHKVLEVTSHKYFLQWYVATVSSEYPFVKQDDEVEELRWVPIEALTQWQTEHPEQFVRNFGEYLKLFRK